MASEKVTQILDVLDSMTLLEFNELKEAFKEKYGVTAAMPVGPQLVTPVSDNNGRTDEEPQTEFTVVLKDAGAQKIQVIKAVREVVSGLGLKEAKDLVDGAPGNVKEGVSKEEAQQIKEKLEAAGASVEVK